MAMVSRVEGMHSCNWSPQVVPLCASITDYLVSPEIRYPYTKFAALRMLKVPKVCRQGPRNRDMHIIMLALFWSITGGFVMSA